MNSNDTDTPDAEDILVRVDEGVAVVALNAPERRNALTPAMARRLVSVCDDIDSNPEVGAAVVLGSGGHFCAGAHRSILAAAGQDPAHPDSYDDNGVVYGSFSRVGRLKVPTIAAVRGSAVGAGVNLMMATDLRIVSTEARILAGFMRIGIHPGGGHFALMGRTAGRETTSAMAIFGQELGGAEAVSRGVAWECVPDDDVEGRAVELAKMPARDPELAREVVASFRDLLGPPIASWDTALQAERARQMWSLRRRTIRNGDT